MLVLTRRPGEALLIGAEIRVVLLEVDGDSVRLGIEAPRTTTILREELKTAVGRENRAATTVDASKAKVLQGLKPPGNE